jgi:hypothetical protein
MSLFCRICGLSICGDSYRQEFVRIRVDTELFESRSCQQAGSAARIERPIRGHNLAPREPVRCCDKVENNWHPGIRRNGGCRFNGTSRSVLAAED